IPITCQVSRESPDLPVGRQGWFGAGQKQNLPATTTNAVQQQKEFPMAKFFLTSAAILAAVFALTADAEAVVRRSGGTASRTAPSRSTGRHVHTAPNHAHGHYHRWQSNCR